MFKKCDINIKKVNDKNVDGYKEGVVNLKVELKSKWSVPWLVGLVITSTLMVVTLLLMFVEVIIPLVTFAILCAPFGITLNYFLKSLKNKTTHDYIVNEDNWRKEIKTIVLENSDSLDSEWLKKELNKKVGGFFEEIEEIYEEKNDNKPESKVDLNEMLSQKIDKVEMI